MVNNEKSYFRPESFAAKWLFWQGAVHKRRPLSGREGVVQCGQGGGGVL